MIRQDASLVVRQHARRCESFGTVRLYCRRAGPINMMPRIRVTRYDFSRCLCLTDDILHKL